MRLPKVPVVNFCPDREKDRTDGLMLPAAVTAENALVRDFCEMKKDAAGVLAVASKLDPCRILSVFYPDDTPLRRLLLRHSEQVRDKALAIAANAAVPHLDRETIVCGALLHDVGVGQCHAPSILCEGAEPYLRHGLLGGAMLRAYGAENHLDLERFARICERHTGSGLTAREIADGKLPLPVQDFLPETPEEKLICLADKFFSKSGTMQEKSMTAVRNSLARFGEAPLRRFDALCAMFQL